MEQIEYSTTTFVRQVQQYPRVEAVHSHHRGAPVCRSSISERAHIWSQGFLLVPKLHFTRLFWLLDLRALPVSGHATPRA